MSHEQSFSLKRETVTEGLSLADIVYYIMSQDGRNKMAKLIIIWYDIKICVCYTVYNVLCMSFHNLQPYVQQTSLYKGSRTPFGKTIFHLQLE